MERKENILKEFEFLLYRLKDKVYEYDHKVTSSFFNTFENSPVKKGELDVKIKLDKSETLLQFSFEINGEVELVCDRSLEEFQYPINEQAKLMFKFGEEFEEVSEDLIILSHGTAELNIAKWLYELIVVHIPFKKLHPKFGEEFQPKDELEMFLFGEDEEDDGLIFVYSDETDEEDENEEESTSHTWESLKNKFNKE